MSKALTRFLNQEPRKLHFYGAELAWMRDAREIMKVQADSITDAIIALNSGDKHSAEHTLRRVQLEVEHIIKRFKDEETKG